MEIRKLKPQGVKFLKMFHILFALKIHITDVLQHASLYTIINCFMTNNTIGGKIPQTPPGKIINWIC